MTQASREETRDDGLTRAIEAAGGVAALARAIGISQPSVSGWLRVPADRVGAVTAATGVPREVLRPDLFAAAGATSPATDPMQAARASEYRLLAALLSRPPADELIDQIAGLAGDPSPLGMAHIRLAEAARATRASAVGEEYFRLFVGVGRGELLPFASYYLTGFLNERPLAKVREDMQRLGVARRQGVHEPEDHIGMLLEVMADLADGRIAGGTAASDTFFVRHLKPWAARFFADLSVAESARFYGAVAQVGATWIEIETRALDLAA